MVLALLRRRLRDDKLSTDVAVKLAVEITRAGELPEHEYYEADALDDGLWLATSGTYGDLTTVRRGITEFLEQYEKFDQQIPKAA
jgi:20S proteasome alpha/beta subunit